MEDLASDEAISAVITEFFSNRNDQEEEKSDFSEEEEQAAVLPAPLQVLLHQQTNLKLDLRSLQLGLHSPHWGLIQIESECFYLVLILSQCSFYTVPP